MSSSHPDFLQVTHCLPVKAGPGGTDLDPLQFIPFLSEICFLGEGYVGG